MGSPAIVFAPDQEQRQLAIDPYGSFMVQAPAGSGKTELLIQRFLRLLAVVERPESIVAITFTRKAAGEMLDRVLEALRRVKDENQPASPHERFTFQLATEALRQDQVQGWNLLENPNRLRIQTIDSLCISIVSQIPWLSRLGAMPQIEENAQLFYEEAARRTILKLEEDGPFQKSLATTLLHLDNDAGRARKLLAAMLASRDQWIELTFAVDDSTRPRFEDALSQAVTDGLEAVDRLIPEHLREPWLDASRTGDGDLIVDSWPETTADQKDVWLALADIVLTKAGTIRKKKSFPLLAELSVIEGLEDALVFLRSLPSASYSDSQWIVLRSLLECLKLSAAELQLVFRRSGKVDFIELGLAARRGLGHEAPTDLAFKMDQRISHLLVDEFQDTSVAQFELLSQLTADWQTDDGRTLFLVGDPMQSIYRFRQAEVGLFLNVRERGIGQIQPESLQLVANYRSTSEIVDWVNQIFEKIFPSLDDVATGAVTYSPSQTQRSQETNSSVTVHAFAKGQDAEEAEAVVQLVRNARRLDPQGSVAILVGARTHLPAIVKALRTAGLRFRALEIDPLGTRMGVRDLLSLTRAMLHRGDRISWLSILRAPWCGLTLADLHALTASHRKRPIWDCLQDLDGLSEDGAVRARRLRNILTEAFAEQGRWPLRRWVEKVWHQLGGPACLQSESDLQDAFDYFDLLEKEQHGGDLQSFDAFSNLVNQLFAQPDIQAEDWLHVMTVHKAKGLQFDTVILPGLGRIRRKDDDRLFLFHQWMDEEGNWERLMAPISEVGPDKDPSYRYLRKIETQKSNHERIRQLYVATTRAKSQLHLLGQAAANSNGEVKPATASMLSDLWPALSEEDHRKFAAAIAGAAETKPDTKLSEQLIYRLPVDWRPTSVAPSTTWEKPVVIPEDTHQPSFEWVSDRLRLAGTVVHLFLQRIARGKTELPDLSTIRHTLMHMGVAQQEIDGTSTRVRTALEKAVNSDRGSWILAAHQDHRCEYSVTGVVDGAIIRGTVDRTFVDDAGIRWIIDYKTSIHQGSGLAEFLDDQQRRYRDQMNRYGRLFASLGAPVRLGLYFPLLDEWREWSLEDPG